MGDDTVLNIGAGKSVIVKNVEADKLTEHLTGVVDRPEPELLGSYKVYHVTADKLAGYNTKTFVIDDINGSAENVVLLGGSFGDTLSASQVREENGYAIADLGDGYELKYSGSAAELFNAVNAGNFSQFEGQKTLLAFDAHNLETLKNNNLTLSDDFSLLPEKLNVFRPSDRGPNNEVVESFLDYTASVLNKVGTVAKEGYQEFKGLESLQPVGKALGYIVAGGKVIADIKEVINDSGTKFEAAAVAVGNFALETSSVVLADLNATGAAALTLAALGLEATPPGLIIVGLTGAVYMSDYYSSQENNIKSDLRALAKNVEDKINEIQSTKYSSDENPGEGNTQNGGGTDSGGGDSGDFIYDTGIIWDQLDREFVDQQINNLLSDFDAEDYYEDLSNNPLQQLINTLPEGGIIELDGGYYRREGDALVKLMPDEYASINSDTIYSESGSDTLAGGGAGDDALISPELFDIGAAFDKYAEEFSQGQVGEQAVAKFIVDAIRTGDIKAATENVAKLQI